jgi:hypothetical protein
MNKLFLVLAIIALAVQSASAGELDTVASKFVAAASKGEVKELASILWDNGPARDAMMAAFEPVFSRIKSADLKLTRIDRELILGELGVTLMRFDDPNDETPNYEAIFCVKVKDQW